MNKRNLTSSAVDILRSVLRETPIGTSTAPADAKPIPNLKADRLLDEQRARAERAEADAMRLAKATNALLHSLGEYVRQSMHAEFEWRWGIQAAQEAVYECARHLGTDALNQEPPPRMPPAEVTNLRMDRATALNRAEKAEAERDHLKRREASIIEACERVADGGQYRADIVSAIQRLRRERDEANARADTAIAIGLDACQGWADQAAMPTDGPDDARVKLILLRDEKVAG
jgi:hypothetical protein